MGGHLALNEHCGALGIQSASQVERRSAERVLSQASRIVGNRDGMQVNNTEKSVVILLQINPVADRAEPVAQMKGARWLDA